MSITWKKVTISEIAEVVTGTTPPTSEPNNYGGDIPFISPADLGEQKYVFSARKYLTKKGAMKARVVTPGSSLFTCIGSTIGKIGLAGRPLTTNQQINAEFLYYALCNIADRVKSIAGVQAVPIINKSEFENQILHIPSSEQIQERIADLLSTWDTAIEKTERLIAAKERRFSSLIQILISSRCENLEHLKTQQLFKTVTEKKNGHEELLSVTQDRGVIPRTMLNGRVMSPNGSAEGYKLIKKGEFAISLRSFQGGVEYSEYQGIISPAYTVLRPSLKVHDEFYRHFFKSYLFIEKYLSIAVIGIRDGKQISIPDFMTVKIPYPPIEVQKEISATLNTARQEIGLLKKQTESLRKQKRGLMQKLLTGKWRVKTKEA